ncbi:hypothetical protein GPECTOR_4g693 [Gonium pectorale]|uniref:Uncharacterized protein n=1 Tax=Gonium pectorale TaxID=33097 RepID=A0A150GY72_GONPE|nr:hypothetical protein GPECTOR_4g693 [Gonium pectorale]|eukprot:KXZ54628.1 hypothetical protein GPECTOR_4g693 [Gonium pectorale]
MGGESAPDPEAEGARLLSHDGGRSSGGSLKGPLGLPRRVLFMLRLAWQHEPLLVATLAGVSAGVVLGTALSFANLSPLALDVIGLPGDLLMRTLKMLVLPLITASVMAGVCALRQSTADMGKVARYTLLYYFTTTMGAVVLGIIIVNVVRPGRGSPFDQLEPSGDGAEGAGAGGCHAANKQTVAKHAAAAGQHSPAEAFLGVIKSAFPDNVFAAAASMNVLGIITVSLLMGAALSSLGAPAAPFIELINIFNDAIGKIVNWVIWTSPVGIASLITTSICRACNLAATLAALGLFVLAVLLGLALWGFIILPAIYYVTTRRNPGQVYRGFSQAMATAFGTDSSNATLPITMRSAVALGCDPRIVQFFLPLGTTVNMNGTALYEAVTVIFIAQAHGVVLGAAGTVIVALTATLAAVGAAGIPSAGLVTMLMVLQAVELDQFAGDIAIILAVDWFLDRCRTVVNVLGDSFGTASPWVIIDHHARKWVVGPRPDAAAAKDPDCSAGGRSSEGGVAAVPAAVGGGGGPGGSGIELVSTAPGVRTSTNTSSKRSFLERKGLTAAEIEEAFRRVPEAPAAPAPAPAAALVQQPAVQIAQPQLPSQVQQPQQPQQQLALVQQPYGAQGSSQALVPAGPPQQALQSYRWSQVVLGLGAAAVAGWAVQAVLLPRVRSLLDSWFASRREAEERRQLELAASMEAMKAATQALTEAVALMREQQRVLAAGDAGRGQPGGRSMGPSNGPMADPYYSSAGPSGRGAGGARGYGGPTFGTNEPPYGVGGSGTAANNNMLRSDSYAALRAAAGYTNAYPPDGTSSSYPYGRDSNVVSAGPTGGDGGGSRGGTGAGMYGGGPQAPYGAVRAAASGPYGGGGSGPAPPENLPYKVTAPPSPAYSVHSQQSSRAPQPGPAASGGPMGRTFGSNDRLYDGSAPNGTSSPRERETPAAGGDGAAGGGRSVPPSPPEQPAYPQSFHDVMDMVQRGITPANVRTDINDAPKDPSRPLSEARLPPPPKPWERASGSGSGTATPASLYGLPYGVAAPVAPRAVAPAAA